MRGAPAAGWTALLAELRGEGFTSLDLLTAVDRLDEVEIVARVVDPSTGAAEVATTRVPSDQPVVPTVAGLYPGARWHERETAEMFGVVFDGHPDPRPLLLRSVPERPPLRKAAPLRERVATPWPGASEGRGRRRSLPPGVQPSWLEGSDG